MANGGEIKYGVGFEVDLSGLKTLQKGLEDILKLTTKDLIKINGNELKNANELLRLIRDDASKVLTALLGAFNIKLGTYNIDTFRKKLLESGTSLESLRKNFLMAGSAGQSAMLGIASSLTLVNLKAKETDSIFDKMGETLKRTVTWNISSSVINTFSGKIQEAYGYVKNLDRSLNDIRIVTNKSAEEMDKFAEKANKAALALGKSTTDYTDASLIYYQQGLSDEETAARTDVTLKAANVTQLSTAAVSEQLTAVWNGYKVSAQEAELYVDKLAAVAAGTAADLEELSTGMSKVASAANLVGVDVDQMNAILATTISVTRQAPETVGTAYKTVLARMTTIAAGGTDEEDGADLTSYTEKMNAFGINVLDANGKLRDMGDVIEEVGGKWGNFSREAQISLAQVMAGTRQYNNLTALFDNWDMYTNSLKMSAEALGTLQLQSDIYMQSTAAHLLQLKTASEGVFDSFLKAEDINGIVDGLTKMANSIEKIVDTLGGGKEILAWLIPLVMMLFSKDIGKGIAESTTNLFTGIQNSQKILESSKAAAAKEFGEDSGITGTYVLGLSAILNSSMSAEEKNKALQKWLETVRKQLILEDLNTAPELAINKLNDKKLIDSGTTYEGLLEVRKLLQEKLTDPSELMSISLLQEAESEQEYLSLKQQYEELIKIVELYNSDLANSMKERLAIEDEYRNSSILIEEDRQEELNKILKENGVEINGEEVLYKTQGRNGERDTLSYKKISKELLDEVKKNALAELNKLKEQNAPLVAVYDKLLSDAVNKQAKAETRVQNLLKKLANGVELTNRERKEIEKQNALIEKQKAIIAEVIAKKTELLLAEQNLEKIINAINNAEEKASLRQEDNVENYESLIGTQNFDLLESNAQEEYKEIMSILDDADLALADKETKLKEFNLSFTEEYESSVKNAVLSATTGIADLGTGVIATITSFNQMGVAMANIWNDKNLSFPEKLGRSLMSLAATSTTVLNGFKSINDGIAALRNASEWLNKANAINTAITEVNTKAKEKNAGASMAEAAGETTSQTAKTANSASNGVNTASTEINTGATIKNTASVLANAAARMFANPWLLAAVAIIGAVSAAILYNSETLKKNTEELVNNAKEQSKVAQEEAEAAELRKTSIDGLVTSYLLLRKENEENSGSLEDLLGKTYELCLQYGELDLALLALVADYQELDDIMQQVQKNANIEAQNKNLDYLEKLKTLAEAEILKINANNYKTGLKGLTDLTFDFGYGVSDREIEYVTRLHELVGDGELDLSGSSWGHKLFSVDLDKIATLSKEINKLNEEFNDLAGHHVMNLKDSLNLLTEAANTYHNAVSEGNLIELDILYNESGLDNIQNYEDYLKKTLELKLKYIDYKVDQNGWANNEDLEEVQKYIDSIMAQSAETAEYTINDTIKLAIIKGGAEGIENLNTSLNEYSDDERNFLYLHIKWLEEGKSPEEILSEFNDTENYRAEKQILLQTNSLIKKDDISLEEKLNLVDKANNTELSFDEFLKSEEGKKHTKIEFLEAKTAESKLILAEYFTWQELHEEELKLKRIQDWEEQKKLLEEQKKIYEEIYLARINGQRASIDNKLNTNVNTLDFSTYADLESKGFIGTNFDTLEYEKTQKAIDTENYISSMSNDDFVKLASTEYEKLNELQKNAIDLMNSYGISLDNIVDITDEYGVKNEILSEQLKAVGDSLATAKQETYDYDLAVLNYLNAASTSLSELENASTVVDNVKKIAKGFNDGGLSKSEMKIYDEYLINHPEYLDLITEINGEYKVTLESIDKFTESLRLNTVEEYNKAAAERLHEKDLIDEELLIKTETLALNENSLALMENALRRGENIDGHSYSILKLNVQDLKAETEALQKNSDAKQKEIDNYNKLADAAGNMVINEVEEKGTTKKEPADIKYKPKYQVDYTDINRTIKQEEDKLKDLQKMESELIGPALTENLKQQAEQQEKLIKLQQLKNDLSKLDLELKKKELEAMNVGAEFDNLGYVSNSSKLLKAAEDEVIAKANAFNASKTDENKEAYETAKQNLDNLKTTIDDCNSAAQAAIDSFDDYNNALMETARIEVQSNLAGAREEIRAMSADLDIENKVLDTMKNSYNELGYASADYVAKLAEYHQKVMKELEDEVNKRKEITAEIKKGIEESLKAAPESQLTIANVKNSTGVDINSIFAADLNFKLGDVNSYNDALQAINDVDTALGQLTMKAKEINDAGQETPKWLADLIAYLQETKLNLQDNVKSWEDYDKAMQDAKVTAKDLASISNWKTNTTSRDLDGISRSLSRLSKEESKLSGSKLIENLNKLKSLIKQLISLKKTLILAEIAHSNEIKKLIKLLILKNALENGLSLNFLKDGSIDLASMYKLFEKLGDKLDKSVFDNLVLMINDFNASNDNVIKLKTELEGLEDSIKDIDDKIKKAADEAAKKAKEKLKKEMELALTMFNAKIDIEVNIEEAWRQLNKLQERVNGLKEFDILGNAKLDFKNVKEYLLANPNSYFGDAGGGSIQLLTGHVNDIANEIRTILGGGTSALYGTDLTKAFGDLENYYNQLMSQVNAYYDQIEAVKQAFSKMIDKVLEGHQELIADLDLVNKLMNHGITLSKLLYGEDSYAELGKYLQQITENDLSKLNEAIRARDEYKALLATIDENKNPEEYKKMKEAYKQAMDDVYSYGEKVLEDSHAELMNKSAQYAKEIEDEIISMAGFASKTLRDLDWEHTMKIDTDYLDATNTEYAIDSLTNKFNKAINDTDSLAGKQKLTDVMNELLDILQKQLEDGQKLTQYDIDRANKVYDLTLKLMALEEQKDNKSKMRLRRDSQGNYRYEYIADLLAIEDKRQELMDAKNELYNFDKKRTLELVKEINELQRKYVEEQNAILEDRNLNAEEKEAALRDLYETYYGEGGLMTMALAEYYQAKTNMESDTDQEVIDLSATTAELMILHLDEIELKEQERVNKLIEGVKEEQKTNEEATKAMIGNAEDLEDAIDNDVEAIKEFITEDEERIAKYAEEIQEILALIAELEALEALYKAVMDAALAAIDAALLLRLTNWDNDEEEDEEEEKTSQAPFSEHGKEWDPSNNKATSGLNKNKNDKGSVLCDVGEDGGYYITPTIYKNWSSKAQKAADAEGVDHGPFDKSVLSNYYKKNGKTIKVKNNHWIQYDTGGYTGSWGKEGKIAMLHEKELVLNKKDTENILAAVNLTRGLFNITSDIMDGLLNIMEDAINRIEQLMTVSLEEEHNIMNALLGLRKNDTNPVELTTEQNQNIHIDAHFPNVSSREEIESAFRNLANRASQRTLSKVLSIPNNM